MNIFERPLYHLARWWWIVILVTVIGGGASYWIGSVSPGPYRAETKVLVNLTQSPGIIGLDDVLVSERLTSTYVELAVTRSILDEVASRLGGAETADGLRANVESSTIDGTQLIRITAKSNVATRAATIANSVAEVFIEENDLQPSGERPGTLSVVEMARPPKDREGPSSILRAALGALAGASTGLILVIGAAYFHTGVFGVEELVGLREGIRSLGIIPLGEPKPTMTDPYRVVTANMLSHLSALSKGRERHLTVAVMSAVRAEGRTSLAARLGAAAASDGHRVVLVDFDLENPKLHEEFNLPNESGLGDLLRSGDMPVGGSILQSTPVEGLRVLTSGQNAGMSTEDLGAAAVLAALEHVAVTAWPQNSQTSELSTDTIHLILLDTPPMTVANAIILGQLIDGAIIVVEAKKTPIALVRSTIAQLDTIQLPVIGVVLNKA